MNIKVFPNVDGHNAGDIQAERERGKRKNPLPSIQVSTSSLVRWTSTVNLAAGGELLVRIDPSSALANLAPVS